MARDPWMMRTHWRMTSKPPYTGIPCSLVKWGQPRGSSHREDGGLGGKLWLAIIFQVDVGKEEPEMLGCIDPHWRTTHWLQVAVQGIAEEELPWYELVTPLTSGVEGTALSLAKHLLTAWQWNIKVRGEDACPPALTILNIGHFMTNEEMAGGVGEPHWFVAYSYALQWVGEAACGQKWEWPMREALEVKASPLVCTFWQETSVDLTVASIKLCWKPPPRALYCQRENGPTAHVITFLDELAVWVPSLDAWDQLVWPSIVAVPQALTEAELYGYCCGQAVDLSPVMPVAQFQVTDEGGAYLCIVRALVFEGSVLAYNPVPVCGLTNDLTWAEERSTVALANYVLHIPVEAAQITRLWAHQIVSCPDDSPMSEEEEAQHPEPKTMDTKPEWGEESEDGARQTDLEEEAEPNRRWCLWDWEAVMEGLEGLAYDDP